MWPIKIEGFENMKHKSLIILILIAVVSGFTAPVIAQEQVSISTGADLYNRYVWRGLDIANTPSLQPSISLEYSGFEFGIWGAYTLSNEASEADEIDFWMGYTRDLENGVSVSVLATDYYFPNAGIDFSNFNNYDVVDDDGNPDPGAHTIEIGLSVSGPETFPITVAGYMNVYNDEGNNMYFQADYPVMVGETELGLFCGLTTGSEENPGYYGADDLAFINVGFTAGRDLVISESLTIPLTVTFDVNSEEEITHLLVGLSF